MNKGASTANLLEKIASALVWLLPAAWLVHAVHTEWRLNAQYAYGYMVPLLTAYLLWQRWEERPAASKPASTPPRTYTFLNINLGSALPFVVPLVVPFALMCAGLGVLHIVWIANPDWRLVYWAIGGMYLMWGLCMFNLQGGRAHIQHFGPAWAFGLFAIPWPTLIEQPLVHGLTGVVATILVEGFAFWGIAAEQRGNVIDVNGVLIGIEEACSGVRSLQSTLMGAVFFGEMMRLALWARGALILIGVGIAIALNIVRAVLLSGLAVGGGAQGASELFGTWHDPIGHAITLVGFLLLWVVATLLEKLKKTNKHGGANAALAGAPSSNSNLTLPFKTSVSILACVALAFGGAHAWYLQSSGDMVAANKSAFAAAPSWETLPTPPTFKPLPELTQALMRTEDGTHAVWIEPNTGARTTVFAFSWGTGELSAFAGVHRPEVCLPSAGFTLTDDTHAPLVWPHQGAQPSHLNTSNKINSNKTDAAHALTFQTYTFTDARGLPHYVFFSVWEPSGSAPRAVSVSAADRLGAAWNAQRVGPRYSLQIIVSPRSGQYSLAQARGYTRALLRSLYPHI